MAPEMLNDRVDMDEIFQIFLPGLGAFAPFAVLAWWVVRTQAKQLEAKEAHYRKITEQIVEALTTSHNQRPLSRTSRGPVNANME